MRDLALSCINAFLLSIVLIPLLQRFAAPLGLVDIPNSRKIHAGRVPLVGAAIFVAFAIAALLLKERPEGFAGFLTGLTMLVVLGVLDDVFDIGPISKLLVQLACVIVMVMPSQTLIWNLGSIFGGDPLVLHHLSVPITIVAIVGMINAVNMIDGIDGVAGCLSLMALLWLAIAADITGLDGELSIALVVGCCVIGFLGFNLRHAWRARAAVFLGDSGSMMLGAIVGFLAIALSQHRGGQNLSPVAVLWICAIPMIDTVSLAFRRVAAGRSPFSTDRRHLHHLMLDAGLTVNQVVVALSAAAGAFGAIGVGGWYLRVPDDVLLFGLAAPISLHTWFVLYGSTHMQATWNALERAKSMLRRPQPLLK
jgi:UDP-GlcNAc:undecaprenyl-phosphate/decaprenyl-phosphate GlcNAc-1-phosphate transferase